jgi:hypothetical protein
MATQPNAESNIGATTKDYSALTFDRFAGVCAIIAGLSSVLYAVFFLLVKGSLNTYLPPIFLALGGFLALPPLVVVYQRVRRAEEGFALWALLLATVGYLGTATHAIFSLAAVTPKSIDIGSAKDLNQADPRGFLAFFVTGVAVLVFAWLIQLTGAFPVELAYVGYVLGVSVILLFLGNLVTATNTSSLLILIPGAVASLLAVPAWNLWLGLRLLQ